MEPSSKEKSNNLNGKSTTKISRTSSNQTTTSGTLPSTSSTLQVPSLLSSEPSSEPSTSSKLPSERKPSTRGQSSKNSLRPDILDITPFPEPGTSGVSSTFNPKPSTSGKTSTSTGQPSTLKRIIMSVFGSFKTESDRNDNDPKGKRAKSSKSSCKGKSAKGSKSSKRGGGCNFADYVDDRNLKQVLHQPKYQKIYINDLKKKYGIKEKKTKLPKNRSRVPVVTITRNRPNKSLNPKPILPDIIVKRSAENPEARKRILQEIKDSKSPIWKKRPSPRPPQHPAPQPSPGGSKRILTAAEQQVAFRKIQGQAVHEYFAEFYALNLSKASEAEEKNAKKKKKKSKTAKLINRLRRDLKNTFLTKPSFLKRNRALSDSSDSDEEYDLRSIHENQEKEETSLTREINDTDSDD